VHISGISRTERRSATAVALSAALAFAIIVFFVLHGGAVVAWDRAVNTWMHARRTRMGDRISVDVSLLGIPGVWILDIGIAVVLLWLRRWAWLLTWIAMTGGGGLLDRGIKVLVNRPRPPYAAEFLSHYSPSFPSGHAMASAIAYLTAVVVLARVVSLRRAYCAALMCLALVIVLAVGLSRVYLAVHYPTDVLGGYSAGIAWSAGVMACTVGVRRSSTNF